MPESAPHTYVAIIDDDDSIGRSMARLLRASGMNPVIYASGEAYFSDKGRPRFDCLVLDVQLAGESGIELRERLRALGSETPVVFLTAHHGSEVQAMASGTPHAACLQKNEPATVVLAAIREAIGARTACPDDNDSSLTTASSDRAVYQQSVGPE